VRCYDDLCEVIGIRLMLPWLVSAIDDFLEKDIEALLVGLDSLNSRDLINMIYWRMQVKDIETSQISISDETLLGNDLIKANIVSSMAKTSFEETEPVMLSIKTEIGAVHAYTCMAKEVAEQDWSLSQALLKTGFDLLEDDSSAMTCYVRFEVLNNLVQSDGPFRNDAVAKCISIADIVSPIVWKNELSFELGHCIAAAFSDCREDEIKFLMHVNKCCTGSDQKSTIQKGLFSGLNQNTCIKLANTLLEHDTGGVNIELQSLECDVEFVALLIERVAPFDTQLAVSLFERAIKTILNSNDIDERNKLSEGLVRNTFESFPEVVWGIFQCCRCDSSVFVAAAESVLSKSLHRKNGFRFTWLLSYIDYAIHKEDENSGELWSRATLTRAMDVERTCKYAPSIETNCNWQPTHKWYQGVIKAIKGYLSSFDDDSWPASHIKNTIEYLAYLNWDAFMQVCRDSKINKCAVGLLRLFKLTPLLLTIEDKPTNVLRDIEYIRKAQDETTVNDDDAINDLQEWILAWSAVHSPETVSNKIGEVPHSIRINCIKKLDHLKPKQTWSPDQASRVIKSLLEYPDTVTALTASADLLSWLNGHVSIDKDLYDELYIAAHKCDDVRTKYYVAEMLKRASHEAAAKLLVETLEHATEQRDEDMTFRCVTNIQDAIENEKGSDDEDVGSLKKHLFNELRQRNKKTLGIRMKADSAAQLLAELTISDDKEKIVCVKSAIQAIEISNPTDISVVVTAIANNCNISAETKIAFIQEIAASEVFRNKCSWHEIDKAIKDPELKIKALTALLEEISHDQREQLADFIAQKAMQLGTGDVSSVLRHVAESLTPFFPSMSVDCFQRSLECAALKDNAMSLLWIVSDLIETCIQYHRIDVDKVSGMIREIALKKKFDSDKNVEFFDWKAICLFASGVIFWLRDQGRFEEYCGEAMKESIYTKNTFWHTVFQKTYSSTYEVYGLKDAIRLVKKMLEYFSDEDRQEMAEGLISLCIALHSDSRPLARYQVWRYALEARYVPIVKELIPICSDKKKGISYLTLAITGNERGCLIDKEEFDKVWSIANTKSIESDTRLKKDLFVANAIVNGTKGGIDSLQFLLQETRKIDVNLIGIVAAVIDSFPMPKELLNELWLRTHRLYPRRH